MNFHTGYLPDYKGLWATNWSIYRGEDHSGYAFHVMDEGIDTGPLIARGRVAIPSDATPAAVARLKLKAARNDVPKVVDAMVSGHFEPVGQPEGGTYFSRTDCDRVRFIADPAKLTADELAWQLHCFAPLQIRLDGTYYPVTALRPSVEKRQRLSFVTADGVELSPHRIQYAPTRLYLAAQRVTALKAALFNVWNGHQHRTTRN